MTWDAYHRRKDVLREMLAVADRDRDMTLPELLDTLDPERDVLEDETAALFEIQMTWFQRLSGHLDRLAADGGETPEMVAIAAWATTAAELPGARALLDAHSQSPALATALAKERAVLAASAGVPVHHPDLGDHGQRIISSARRQASDATPLSPTSAQDAPPQGLLARLRSVIAA